MSLDDIRMRIILGVGGFEQLQKLRTSLDQTGAAGKTAAGGIGTAGGTAKSSMGFFAGLNTKLSETQGRYQALITAGFEMQLVGGQLNRVGQKGIEVLQGSLDAWGDYQFTLNRAAGALGVWNTKSTASQLGTDKLNDAVHSAAEELRIFPAGDVAKAVYFWGSATGDTVKTQKDLQKVMASVTPIMKAAAVTQTDYESAIKGVYSILVQYHKPTSAAADVTDKLLVATQKTALEFPDLINAFKMVGPLAAANHVSFEDMVILMGRMGDAGIRGTQSGRAFRQVFMKLVKPTEAAKTALDKVFKSTKGLGKSFDDIIFPKGKFIGMEGYLNALSKATENMTDKERNQFLATISTANMIPTLTALIDQQTKVRHKSADAMDMEKYSLDGATKNAASMFDLLKTSWQGTWGSVQRVFETITHLVGERLATMLTPIVEGFGKFAKTVEDLIKNNPGLTDIVITITAFGSIALAILGTLILLGGTFLVLSATLGQFGPLVGAIAGASLPVIAAIAAIVAIVVVLYKAWTENWGGIQQIVGDAVSKVMAGLSLLASWVQKGADLFVSLINGGKNLTSCLTGLPEPINAIVTWLAQLWLAISSGVQQVIPVLITIFNTAVDLFVNHVVPAIQQIVAAFLVFWNFLQPILIQMGQIIVDTIIAKVIPALVEFATAVGSYVVEILQQLGPVIDSVVALFTGLINFIFKDLAPVWDWLITNVFMPFFSFLVDMFATRFTAIIKIVQGAWEVVKGVIQVALGLIKGIIDIFLAVVNGKWDAAGKALATMVDTIWHGILSIVHGVATALQGVIEFALTKIVEIIGGGLNAAKNLFTGILGRILDIFKGAGSSMVGLGKGLLTSLWNGVSGAIGWLAGLIGGLIRTIVGWFTSKLPQQMQDIGKNVIEGIWNGIKSLAGWLAGKVINLVKDIIPGPIRDALGIHSPSKVTMELGRMVALGLAAGIAGNTAPVLGSVDALTGAVIARAGQGSKDMTGALASAGLNASANYSFSSNNERTVTLRVEVTSPDGSVDQLTADRLAALIKGSEMVEAIEHAASLG